MDKLMHVCNTAKKKIVPSPRLKRIVEAKAEEIRQSVDQQCRKRNLNAEVRLDGSVAKDTWIRGYEEVDIFMRVSPELTKEQLENVCLPIARQALRPNLIVERFAEHPYIESMVKFSGGKLRVNVVPCYDVQQGDWRSATDRTPYHTEYVHSHLAQDQRDEVRLLKAFLRGIGSYGADIKTGGFSGMICETLVMCLGSFLGVVTDFTKWTEDRFLDLENYYQGRTGEVRKIFREPLIVIDPVDKGRNLGAAVRRSQLWNFVAASRHFTDRPSSSMFFEPRIKPVRKAEFHKLLKKRGSEIICISMGRIDAVVDNLWSQLFRTERAIVQLLENKDFKVMKSAAWSDEKRLNILIFELESSSISGAKKHYGPPISKSPESSSFLSKHVGSRSTVAGPWVENDRWAVMKSRDYTSARVLLDSILLAGGRGIGAAPLVGTAFKRDARLWEGLELIGLIAANEDFARFMKSFLSGRPAWLA